IRYCPKKNSRKISAARAYIPQNSRRRKIVTSAVRAIGQAAGTAPSRACSQESRPGSSAARRNWPRQRRQCSSPRRAARARAGGGGWGPGLSGMPSSSWAGPVDLGEHPVEQLFQVLVVAPQAAQQHAVVVGQGEEGPGRPAGGGRQAQLPPAIVVNDPYPF